MEAAQKPYFSYDAQLPSAVPLEIGPNAAVSPAHWYALYVRSRHEKVVENGLKGKGYNAFSPFYITKRKRVDRTAEVEVPLFPGYVFCHFDSNQRRPILMTPGIVGVVARGKKPEPVDDTEIASLRSIALSGRPVQPWPFLNSSQRVRVQSGPLTGAEGIFLRIKDEHHLIVSITLLQRAVSVVVDKQAVAPVFLREPLPQGLEEHKIRHYNF